MRNKITYRQQYTRCGKERCHKCKEGVGHGPYWYAYWSENGRTVSKYIGLHRPPDSNTNNGKSIADKPASTPVQKVIPSPLALSPSIEEATNQNNIRSTSDFRSEEHPLELPLQLPTQVLRIYVLGQFRID